MYLFYILWRNKTFWLKNSNNNEIIFALSQCQISHAKHVRNFGHGVDKKNERNNLDR